MHKLCLLIIIVVVCLVNPSRAVQIVDSATEYSNALSSAKKGILQKEDDNKRGAQNDEGSRAADRILMAMFIEEQLLTAQHSQRATKVLKQTSCNEDGKCTLLFDEVQQ